MPAMSVSANCTRSFKVWRWGMGDYEARQGRRASLLSGGGAALARGKMPARLRV